MTETTLKFRSIILAGERPGGSPISHAFGVAASVMVPVAGIPSLQRVIHAISDSTLVDGGMICGPAAEVVAADGEIENLLQHSDHAWMAPATGPAASAVAAAEKMNHYPCLLTAGDHALLTGEIVDEFCASALKKSHPSAFDLIIGFVPYALVKTAWPQSKRTVLKFADGAFCGSNLFAIINPEGRKALRFWRQAEADRKHPWRIARRFGFTALLLYIFRRLTLEEVLKALSKASGCRIGYVAVNFARAAVDVDSVEDQKLAEQILSSSGKKGGD